MPKKIPKPRKEVVVNNGSLDAQKYMTDKECPNCYIPTDSKPWIFNEENFIIKKKYVHYKCSACNTEWRIHSKTEVRYGRIVLYVLIAVLIGSLVVAGADTATIFSEETREIALFLLGVSMISLIAWVIVAMIDDLF